MGLLFYCYLAKKFGFKTIYLGQSLPYQDLKSVIEVQQPSFLVSCSAMPFPSPGVYEYMTNLSEFVGQDTPVYFSFPNAGDPEVALPSNFKPLSDVSSFGKILREMTR